MPGQGGNKPAVPPVFPGARDIAPPDRYRSISDPCGRYLIEMLLGKITPESRRDHVAALGILKRHIHQPLAPSSSIMERQFSILAAGATGFRWILLVEDQAACAKLARVILEGEGYAVVVARTASAAIDELHVGAPSLIVLDLKLPDRDGLSPAGEVVLVWRGRVVVIASNVEDFITRLANADTGIFSLDIGDHAGRKHLATWWRLALRRRLRRGMNSSLPLRFRPVTERSRSAVRPGR
jgi:CheY-like chemotaxis protein